SSAPIFVESSLRATAAPVAALPAVQNLSSTLVVGRAIFATPVMTTTTTKAQSVISSLPVRNASAAAAESHAVVFAVPVSYESVFDDSRLSPSTHSSDASTVE